MTQTQRKAQVAPGFIQHRVVVRIPGQEMFRLPPVIGRSFSNGIADLLLSEHPGAFIRIVTKCHTSQDGLHEALQISDEVSAVLMECQRHSHPGTALVEHFKAVARIGGEQ